VGFGEDKGVRPSRAVSDDTKKNKSKSKVISTFKGGLW